MSLQCTALRALDGSGHRRDRKDDQGDDCLCTDVDEIIDRRVGCRIPALPGILAEEYPAAQKGEDVSSDTGSDVAEAKTVLMACEEAGNTKCTEGEHIIEDRLYRCQYVWVNDELQDTIGYPRRDADRPK